MKRGVRMFTACCVAAGMTFTGASSIALAAKDTSLAGLDTANRKESTDAQEVEGKETTADTSMKGERAFAQCDEYINIRSSAGTDANVVGKVYNNGAVTILAQEGDWYKVESGNATGYVKKEYFATGEKAEQIAKQVGYSVATVYTDALMVRSSADTSSEEVGIVYESDEMEVVSYEGDWMKVILGDGTYGYVNANYVGYDTYYKTAETLEEEQARLDAEWLAYLAEQEAIAEAQAAYYEPVYVESYVEPVTYTYVDETAQQAAWDAEYLAQEAAQATTDAQGNADQAYQNYLDAQAAADAATQQADEQLVYDAAAQAEQAYQEYLNAQAAADAQAQAAADAAAQAQAAQQAVTETTYTETYTETTDTSYTDTSYTTPSYDTSNVDAAWQAYLDAQAAADAATQQADTQLVYDTAASATAAYEAYLSAVAAADAAGVPTNAETTYTQTTTETYTETVEETTSSSNYSLGQQIADYACQFVGNPYVWGGSSLTNGADCSGFTMAVYNNFGISLPHSAASQSGYGTPVSMSDLQPGDLLFYNGSGGIGHVTMYIGNGQVVHASSSTTGIIISSVDYRTPCSATRLI